MHDYDSAQLKELDSNTHLHPFTDYSTYSKTGGRIYTEGEGIYIRDMEGRRILDGMSGLWCTNLGYTQPAIVNAITEQLQRLP